MSRRQHAQLPELSRFELQCLRRLWKLGEASVRQVQSDTPDAPGYSTFRKIFERLEEKGAIVRVRMEGRAWIYRSAVPPRGVISREVRRLLEGLFEGRSRALLAYLADAREISIEDLREVEKVLEPGRRNPHGDRSTALDPTARTTRRKGRKP